MSTHGKPWTMDVYKHMLVVVSDGYLYRNKKVIERVNGICSAGTRVSIVCPPQDVVSQESLPSLLHESATIFEVPSNLKAAEIYDLGKLIGRSPTPFFQTITSRLLDYFVECKFHNPISSLPVPSRARAMLMKPANAFFKKITSWREEAAEKNAYWQHFRKHQLSPSAYRKYEDLLSLESFEYNYFYFIKALLINKEVEPIDAVYTFSNYIWSLPVGCMLKEILGVSLLYDTNPAGQYNLIVPAARVVASKNEDWMVNQIDHFVDTDKQEIVRARESSLPTYKIEPSQVMAGNYSMPKSAGKLNIAVLYDETWAHVGTIYEYLDAFRRYLPHNVEYIPATINNSVPTTKVDLSVFDVVISHYSVVLCVPAFIDPNIAKQMAEFKGIKILFTQDEYETTETTRTWMDKLHFDIVYTCVPKEGHELIFPSKRFPQTRFVNVLTGYVPEDSALEEFATPLEERELFICYRGRILPYHYGLLGYEKYEIGIEVRRLAEERGLPVDIELDESRRIYGNDWYHFLGSARATLGTESGSNVFDFDGNIKESIAKLRKENPRHTFEYIHKKLVAEHEGFVKMNQISPKIFEAIQLRTALVLFEGEYSGVVIPHEHFIPLKKDYSNFDEIVEKLKDLDYLKQMTERAYVDIIASGKYSYKQFIKFINEDIESEFSRRNMSGLKESANSKATTRA